MILLCLNLTRLIVKFKFRLEFNQFNIKYFCALALVTVAEAPLKYCFHYAHVLYKRHCHSCRHGFHVINAWLVASSSEQSFVLLSRIIIPRPVSPFISDNYSKTCHVSFIKNGSINIFIYFLHPGEGNFLLKKLIKVYIKKKFNF